jgi:hypothetical protein
VIDIPGPAPLVSPTTLLWADAYTMQLEATAEAIACPEIRKHAQAALRQAESDLAVETDEAKAENLHAAVANQQQVLKEIGSFDVDAYREIMARWRSARGQILRAGWDLTQDIDFIDNPKRGVVIVSQGKGAKQFFSAGEAQIVLAFLQFVNANQDKFDPLSHVKRILARQGITADNFEIHRDRLCIDNPWAPSPTPPTSIIQGKFT